MAREAGISHGAVQHYFATREEMLVFTMDFASEQTSRRVAEGVGELGNPPHPRDMLRVMIAEMFPLHPDARATSRMSAAYVLDALHDANIHARARDGLAQGRDLIEQIVRQAITDGHIGPDHVRTCSLPSAVDRRPS